VRARRDDLRAGGGDEQRADERAHTEAGNERESRHDDLLGDVDGRIRPESGERRSS
jgi:hypothetical protein